MKDWHCGEVLALAIGLLLVAQWISPYPGCLLILATTSAVVLLTGSARPRNWLMMLLTPAGFLLTSFAVAPLCYRAHVDLLHSFYIDPELLRRVELVSLRSLASASCTLMLLCARSPVEWAAELPGGTAWRFLADLLVLMERYFYLLRDSARAILVAQEARLSHVSWRRQIVSFSLLCSTLLMRAEQRAARLEDALEARLYTGELVVRRAPIPRSNRRLVLILLLVVAVAVVGKFL